MSAHLPPAPWEGLASYLGSGDGAGGGERYVSYRVEVPCEAGELLESLVRSRRQVQAMLGRGALALDGRRLGRTDALSAGDVVRLELVRGRPAPLPAGGAGRGSERSGTLVDDGRRRAGDLKVLRLDPFLMAVDKPAGILVHGDGTGKETLTDLAAAYLAHRGVPAVPQAVQRLDVETTGVLLFSLAAEFQPALDALVASHGMRKLYLAAVEGDFPTDVGRIDEPLGRDRHDARRMRVSAGGKPSLTLVRVLAKGGGRTLLLAELRTGRRHQIRVHLAHLGFPIVGDALYGRSSAYGRPGTSWHGSRHGGAALPGGLMLHAYEEDFVHPATGESVRLRTEWPSRFEGLFSEAECAPRVHTDG